MQWPVLITCWVLILSLWIADTAPVRRFYTKTRPGKFLTNTFNWMRKLFVRLGVN
ncbi:MULTISPECIES: hypothetical protein [unclassified Mycobacteroides]|uniref:hypothetical protein n=1 Tax=unclassified Mycobacteroides TaxID=2618759 RepID=UPI000A9D39ED|nr:MULTISPECIES: hypothetical protein [unclassified Mycobacteroides]